MLSLVSIGMAFAGVGPEMLLKPQPKVVQAGPTFIQKILNDGIPVPWVGILILAGCIPFVPFSYLGYAGVNLMVTGSIGWALVKAFVQVAFTFMSMVSSEVMPDLWLLPWVFMYSPWYIYDIIQMFNPKFAKEGFKIPFLNRNIGRPNGILTVPIIGLIIVIVCAGLSNFLEYLPDNIISSVKPIINWVLAFIGGGTAVVGGGAGAYAMGPTILEQIRANMGSLMAAPADAAAPAEVAAQLQTNANLRANMGSLTAAPAAAQLGGARIDLDAIAKDLIKDTSSGIGAYLFVGTMAIIALGGGAIAVARTK